MFERSVGHILITAGDGGGGSAGREDRGADHRWPRAFEDPAWDPERPKVRMRSGVPSAAVEGLRGDQIVTVEIVVPQVQDERSKGDFARAGAAESGRSAWELFSKV